ncbi:MAG TPA: arginine--tRNA ligase [Candidatus Limnocylindrales bacterium]|nr:arginine--tRNA ligase [Candidatus Limnocylindrales bacterium]
MTESARTRVAPASPLRTQARAALERARTRAVASGALPEAAGGADAPPIEIERPADAQHGDLASNLAMKLARACRMAPLAIANAIAAELEREIADKPGSSPLAGVEVAPPGFINLRLADHALEGILDGVLRAPAEWGRVEPLRPRSVNVEFVSANPTGPLHIGNARGAFVGDLLSRLLEAGGQTVTREYYFNDFGMQVRNLGRSVVAIRRGEPVPDDGYHGDYVHDLARDVPPDVAAEAEAGEAADVIGRWATERVRGGIEESLARLGVHFDVWTSESRLHREGWVNRAIERLRENGHVYEQDGAVWFRSTTFGDDKDRPLIRSSGEPTYLAADVGYLLDKFSRGFDHLLYIWGADHHGYIARTRGAAEGMGFDPARFQVLLTGWVSILRGGQVVAMSKRAGDIYLLDTLLEEIGNDAARWFFASRGANLDIEVDVELARRQSSENPVYYVQYAHARIASILRKAGAVGLPPADSVAGALSGAPEAALARIVARLPEVVEDAVLAEETHSITAYCTELATTFHAFYRDARVVDTEAPERSAKRLALAEATRVTLANALGLLGISAPESM